VNGAVRLGGLVQDSSRPDIAVLVEAMRQQRLTFVKLGARLIRIEQDAQNLSRSGNALTKLFEP
jgi:hypothetical protein